MFAVFLSWILLLPSAMWCATTPIPLASYNSLVLSISQQPKASLLQRLEPSFSQ